LRAGVGFIVEAFIGKKFARHDEARSFARVGQIRNLSRVDRVDDRRKGSPMRCNDDIGGTTNTV
jgi:hypothetical protein